MTISVRQSATGSDNAANYQATLASAPVAGNLLMAYICERSGATEGTVVESGWTRVVDHPQSSGDSTNRKYLAVAYKVAGASESSTVSWTLDNGSSVASGVGIVEFQSDSSETFTFENAVVTGSDATVSSHSTGTTASIPNSPQLLVGLCYTKTVTSTEHPYSDWSGGTDALTEFAQLDDGNNGRDISWAFANDTGTGTKSSTAAVTAGSSAQRGSITTLAVFSVSSGGGGGVDLVIAEASHAHTADNVALTQTHALTVADASHAHAADNLTLAQTHNLTIADATHAHAADNLTLSTEVALTIADASHAHAADSPTLTQVHQLTIQDAAHAHAADNVTLAVAGSLVIQDATHAHTADNVALTVEGDLPIDSATHAHAAENVTLTQVHNLTIADSSHAHTADTLTLNTGSSLTVQSATHAHSAGSLTLTQVHVLDIAAAGHAHAAETLALSQVHTLVIDSALHAHRADMVNLAAIIRDIQISATIHPSRWAAQLNGQSANASLHPHTWKATT